MGINSRNSGVAKLSSVEVCFQVLYGGGWRKKLNLVQNYADSTYSLEQ